MGIARRKAGTVVRCPSCASQVTVPHAQGEGAAAAAESPAAPLFERNDFDELFNPPVPSPPPKQTEVSPLVFEPYAPPEPAPRIVEPVKPRPSKATNLNPSEPATATTPATGVTTPHPGFWVTPAMATLLVVAAIVILALVFAGGLLLGTSLRGDREDQSTRPCSQTTETV
jgi:hypothetical protein